MREELRRIKVRPCCPRQTLPKQVKAEDLIGIDCDIWIPAARPDVISGAERRMHERGLLSVPDFIANAGPARWARCLPCVKT
jgi:glutamate dehydrogenase/leucine dehydrogenase